eukprot:982426-Pyramimonas_sp.AAC.1
MTPRAMALSFPFVFVVIFAERPSPNWAARRLVAHHEREVMVFVMPMFIMDAFGEVTSIAR